MELKPTLLAGVPRVFERIYEGIQTALQDLNPIRRTIFHLLYKYKLGWMNMGFKQKKASPFADILAFRKVKARLGGRVRLVVSGGAPLGVEVEEFLRVTSCALFVQGYGLTETCGMSTICFPDEMCMLGAVGVPFVCTEVRLVEVPEMGYNPLSVPSRGEVCVRGRTLFSGYFKNPDLTRDSFKDGWFHTGDIGEMLPNGVIKIIDRRKNLIKLSQGEYVALDYLEKVYCVNPFVEDIWIYGNGLKAALVAVVVPSVEKVKKWGEMRGLTHSFGELCEVDDMANHILRELISTADSNKLRGFERIKGVFLESKPFESDPALVTPTLKKRRDRMLKQYQAVVDRLYHNLAGFPRANK